jgi:hypothetical protein
MDGYTTLVKNFCAWLRICTAVLVPMCSARTGREEECECFLLVLTKSERTRAQREREREAGMLRTLYVAPGATVQLQGLQEPPVLVLRPLLPLLRDRVRLPRLQVRQAWKKQNEKTRIARILQPRPRFAAAVAIPWGRAPPLTNPCRGGGREGPCDDPRRSRRLPSKFAAGSGGNTHNSGPKKVRLHRPNQSGRVNFKPGRNDLSQPGQESQDKE